MNRHRLVLWALSLALCVGCSLESLGQPRPPGEQPAEGPPTVHIGRVVIESTGEGVVIAVDERLGHEDGGDGIAEVVYLLQQELPAILDEDYPFAQVRAWPTSVEVHPSPPARGWVFALADDTRSRSAAGLERVEGYGLAVQWGHSLRVEEEGLDSTHFSDPLEKDPSAPGSGGGCDSGGVGSSQCSIGCKDGTSCGITCNSGYFSCCVCTATGARCRCTRSL